MPGARGNPSRVRFTAGLPGRNPGGSLVSGSIGPQTDRAFERLEAVLARAGAKFENGIKQLTYVTDLDAYSADGRSERAKFFGSSRSASTGMVVRRLADPTMLIESELVADVQGSPEGKSLLAKYNVEHHGEE